jgi:tRNA A-37 threonylcarbamoyl transferase component Bud32
MNEIAKQYGQDALKLVVEVIGSDTLGDLIGSGSYGQVYQLLTPSGSGGRVIKLQYNNYHKICSEISGQQCLSEYGLAPHIFRTEALRNGRKAFVVILMEEIDGVLSDLLSEPLSDRSLQEICTLIYDIIIFLCKIQFVHGDMHWDNIGYVTTSRKTIRLILIDFGFSHTESRCNPRLEIAQLIRTLDLLQVDAGNAEYIDNYFTTVYENHYGPIGPDRKTHFKRLQEQHVALHNYEMKFKKSPKSNVLTPLFCKRTPEKVTRQLQAALKNHDYYRVNRILETQPNMLNRVIDLPEQYFRHISAGALFNVIHTVGDVRGIEVLLKKHQPRLVDVLHQILRVRANR